MTIVANAPVALIGSRRDRKYGRTSSPARRRQEAAAPRIRPPSRGTSCAKLALPSGSSRYCQRHARMTRFDNIVASDSSSHPGLGVDDLATDAAEVDIAEEQPQQRQRQHDNGDCADM